MFRLIESLGLMEESQARMAKLRKESPNAREQGKTECCKSGICCWRRPGSLTPDDVARISGHLDITEKELFARFLVVDEIKGLLKLLPRRKHQEAIAGTFVPWRETYSLESPCVWLGDGNSCMIQEVKPASCAAFKCWDESTFKPADGPDEWTREALMALGWDGYTDEGDAYED